ncbi:terminase large subunit domain-containing protein [Natronorarus salvus]|uniref:terminase large subunit domain-containing protein n=1 Tax=Natronorarus salvus TaxID=3117733 RepID=UPI002F26278A
MPGPTIRSIERRIELLEKSRKNAGGIDGSEIYVEWREADSENRPEGIAWRPPSGDEPALLSYDVWDTQQRALTALLPSDSESARESTKKSLARTTFPAAWIDGEGTSEADLVGFLAGYGSGKSVTGARWLIAQALVYPESRFLVLGTDFQKARDTTFRVLFENLPGERTGLFTSSYNGPENSPIVADYNRSEHRLTLVNDSVIVLGSADRWNRYAGDEYGAIWKDEPSHYGEDLHDLLEMMGSRLRGVEGPKKMFWTLTGNGYNAAWEILEKNEDANGDPIGLNIELIRASTFENPYLTDGERDLFRRQYAGTSREEQALRGEFAAAQGLVYDRFRRETHVVPHSKALEKVDESNRWRIYGYDAGWNDPRVLLEIARTPYEQFIVIDEYHESESHVDDAIRWLEANDKPKETIYCEHEPSDIQQFCRHGFEAERANKSQDPGIDEIRRYLRSENDVQIDEVSQTTVDRSEPEQRPGLLVSDKCEHLIREFQGYKKEQVGKSSATDHCLDSLRYALFTHSSRPEKKKSGPIIF